MRYDLIVVPGFLFANPVTIGPHMGRLRDEVAELRAAIRRRRRVASICVGAYLLGAIIIAGEKGPRPPGPRIPPILPGPPGPPAGGPPFGSIACH